MEQVILIDKDDKVIGSCEKLEAHRKGLLHRAFSIFIFNQETKLILQKRAGTKYHSAGLWTNTCCGHPRPGEELQSAAQRRLQEEMGILCELRHQFSFLYNVTFENGLIENELDHVFAGYYNGIPKLNTNEAWEWKAVDLNEIKADVLMSPDKYTYWFRQAVKYLDKLTNM